MSGTNPVDAPAQKIQTWPFSESRIKSALISSQNPFSVFRNQHRQFDYILEKLAKLKCESYIIEHHYVDRDFMDDHSVFYSKNLVAPPNWCKRIHFFAIKKNQLDEEIKRIRSSSDRNEYQNFNEELSKRYYLGFSVLRPLATCPIGRTVLRLNGRNEHDTAVVEGCDFISHVNGIKLRIKGVPFQQQDFGVSACATTALWSALHQMRRFEPIRPSTPVWITLKANEGGLPFGRPLPTEGLSIGQMCHTLRQAGAPPKLVAATNLATDLAYIHSSVLSDVAPVLVLNSKSRSATERHAVVLVGAEFGDTLNDLKGYFLNDIAWKITAVIVHDDRLGPYVRAPLIRPEDNSLEDLLIIRLPDENNVSEEWCLSHFLFPLHEKVRISYPGLRGLAIRLFEELSIECEKERIVLDPVDLIGSRIIRSNEYLENLLFTQPFMPADLVGKIAGSLCFPRYLGVITFKNDIIGELDFLIDTTRTQSDPRFVGILSRSPNYLPNDLIKSFARRLKCSYF